MAGNEESRFRGSASTLQTTSEAAAPHRKSKPAQPWYTWIISKPFDWISTPFYLGGCLTLAYGKDGLGDATLQFQFQWWQVLIILCATFILLGLDRYEFYRWGEDIPGRIAIIYFGVRLGLILLISWVNPNEITFFMLIIIPFSALLYFGSRVGIGVGLLVWLFFLCRVLFFHQPTSNLPRPIPFINIFTLCLIFIMTTGYTLIREKTSRAKAERLFSELAESQREVEELAATKERNRLARDIHDSLGHYLTVISVLLGKARAFKEKNPPEADQALDDARRLANEALQDVRESVKSLRTSQELFSLVRSLPILVANLESEHLTIALEISGSEEGFSKQSLMVLYRVAQEGLTNVQRHSGANLVKLFVSFEPHEARLVLEDNGRGFDPQIVQVSPRKSYGLSGLQERLEMIGGEFCLESQPGQGTRLVAAIAKNSPSPDDIIY